MKMKQFGEFCVKMLGVEKPSLVLLQEKGFLKPEEIILFFEDLAAMSWRNVSHRKDEDLPDNIFEHYEVDFDLRRDLMKRLTELMETDQTCHWCGHTGPLIEDEYRGWPYCANCEGV